MTFQAIGYYGIYAVNSTCGVLSVLYLLLVCKENPDGKPFEPKTLDDDDGGFLRTYVWNGLIQPVIDLFQTMNRRRPHGMRVVLCVMLLNMVFYYSTIQEIYILYQFCKLKYDVTYTEYSVMNTFGNFVNFCSLAFLVPTLIYGLKLHEGLAMFVVASVGALSLTVAAYAKNIIPAMMIPYGLASIRYALYPIGRALLTKMVEPSKSAPPN